MVFGLEWCGAACLDAVLRLMENATNLGRCGVEPLSRGMTVGERGQTGAL